MIARTTAAAAFVLGIVLACAGPAGAAVRVVHVPGRQFDPVRVTALVGDQVRWINDDVGDHTATADDGSFDSGVLSPGATFTATMTAEGTVSYACSIHANMHGVIDVHGLALGASAPRAAGLPVELRGLGPIPGGVVTVQAAPATAGGEAQVVATAVAGPDGSFVTQVVLDRPTWLQARSGSSSSAPLLVRVQPRIRIVARRGAVSVRADAGQAGARVRLEVWLRERYDWRPLARGRLDARGRVRLAAPRGAHVRVLLVHPRLGFASVATRTVVVR